MTSGFQSLHILYPNVILFCFFQHNHFVILKNSDTVNEKLRQVKHLVRILPVTFPYGEPKDESDLAHMWLKDNGQMVVRQKLNSIPVVDARPVDKWAMEKDTVVTKNRKKLNECTVALEYFPPKFVYRFNQDGQEHRYTNNLSDDEKKAFLEGKK